MKYILIPTDFSESARNASEFGIELAKLLNLPIKFLHSIQTPIDWSKLNKQDENKYPESKAKINNAKEQLKSLEKKAEDKQVEAEHTLIFNTGMQELNNYVNPENYELVIMGTHGTKGFQKILGSNTQKLIRQSKVPVLAIKHKFNISNLNKILIATDLKEESQSAFQHIIKILGNLNTEKNLIYINTPYNFKEYEEIESLMSNFLKNCGVKNIKTQSLSANNEARGIGMAINKIKPDLFTSITHQRSGLDTIFSPSITEEIINNYDIPVLSINREI